MERTDRALTIQRLSCSGREDLSEDKRADHLAVLMFMADAEGVPLEALRNYISEEKLMASTLYQEIQAKAEARTLRDTITRILTLRLGSLESGVRERIQALDDAEALKRWYEEALLLVDAESARQMVDKLKRALLS